MSYDHMGTFRTRGSVIHWMTIRDCSCQGTGQIESDWDAGVYYPCDTCNPDWCRLPFDRNRQPVIRLRAGIGFY